MMKKLALLATVGMLSACSQGSQQDLVAYTEEVRATAIPSVSPLPEMPELVQIGYTGSAFRNPYEPAPLSAPGPGTNAPGCPQPNLDREREELESFGLDQFTLVGTMRTNQQQGQVALVSTNQGRLYRVAEGNYLGLNLGRITRITQEFIMIEEWVPAGDGCWQQRETALRLPGTQGSTSQ